MSRSSNKFRTALLGASAMVGVALMASPAAAQDARQYEFDMPAQPLTVALKTFGATADQQLIFSERLVEDRTAPALKGAYTPDQALAMLLAGSGLVAERTPGGVVTIRGVDQAPQSGSASDGADGTVDTLVVTAQKREEDIQDVPIAISAFTQESLERSQIAGGPDLMTQIPNMTFTKTNFASYSIQIRGIGTQAISATTDPAVAVAFNNTPFIRNRFFEQEFYDLARVEVLRGPQGTLYGRNATAGVVNIISQKPKFVFEAKARADVANYNSTRLEGMVNIPLVEDAVALRLAGAWTKRDGFVTNEITGNPIDGRDLWSTRVSLRIAPPDARFDVNLIWEHFEEDDDRLRSGKQLCKRHRPEFLTSADGTQVPINLNQGGLGGEAGYNQGCERVSLYSPEAFQVPNGNGLPYYQGLQGIGMPLRDAIPGNCCTDPFDPYLSATQSRDLRVIESTVDPDYRANSNLFELQANVDLSDSLTLTSETSYATDELFSMQDLNRFNTTPGVFANHSSERVAKYPNYNILTPGPNGGGIFCDPQIGCSDRLVALDLSTAESTQFSQELRLGSDFDGPFNFSLGANFLRYDTVDKYYVFINTITLTALNNPFWNALTPTGEPPTWVPGVSDNRGCLQGGQGPWLPPDPSQVLQVPNCLYIDPNPIGSLNDKGHNYFLSKNPYKLISYAVFGEAYYQLAENLKLTGGLRWTVDKKEAPRLPSMLLAADTIGLTVEDVIEQEWREPSGRLALDWKPDLSFTDETMIYASYAHGYKAGGANPPPTAVITYGEVAAAGRLNNYAIFPRTFDPEFVDAFEIGAKNTLLDGALTFNTAAFYYDYKNYQVSEIVERSALNRNFDAEVWGVEIEADWRPIENLKLSFKGGYEKTRIGDGEEAIDLMDRTAGELDENGNPKWVVVKPFPASPSNCIIPTWLATWNNQIITGSDAWGICTPIVNGLDPITWLPYVTDPTIRTDAAGPTRSPPTSLFANWGGFPANFWQGYPGYDPTTNNNSTGVAKQLGGNELPNAPEFTATVSADYTVPLPNDWTMALHGDIHWQSESWWRVFNDHEYNKLDEFYLINVAAILSNEETGWNIMAYVKNVLDEDAMTGAFLFSDDTGLTTNVFLTEPRLYGLRATKEFNGGPLLGSFGRRREGNYPFTLELGGQAQQHDAPYETLEPGFASSFTPTIDPLATQHQDLDWGDGRSVRLTYRPDGPWKIALEARSGESNGTADEIRHEFADYTYICAIRAECQANPAFFYQTVDNYSDSTVVGKEEHTVIEFQVGREAGIGFFSRSEVAAGVRYARLQSHTDASILGTPNWELPEYRFGKYGCCTFIKYDSYHNEYEADLTADRSFRGAGPVLSWSGTRDLVGDDTLGQLGLDVSVAGGVLFGKQKTRVNGFEQDDYFEGQFPYGNFIEPTQRTTTPIAYSRSKSVSAPVVDLSLGLSYRVDRFGVSAGYRWERYFDAIDGGYDERKDADRTIDGPYFKLAIGFGG